MPCKSILDQQNSLFVNTSESNDGIYVIIDCMVFLCMKI